MEVLALAIVASRLGDGAPRYRRCRLLLGESSQIVRRRLGADPVRRFDGAPDPDLAAWHQHSRAQNTPHRSAARYAASDPPKAPPSHPPGPAHLPAQPA